jgi:hypothetical protein
VSPHVELADTLTVPFSFAITDTAAAKLSGTDVGDRLRKGIDLPGWSLESVGGHDVFLDSDPRKAMGASMA